MELAMQIISSDKTIRSNTVQDLKEFNSQPLTTQAKKEEKLVSKMPAIKKTFDLMSGDIVVLSTENETLKKQIGEYDEKWPEESQAKLFKHNDNDERANLIMSRLKKQMEEH